MSRDQLPSPLKPTEVADLYFMQHRAALIDVAAFLDRYYRAAGSGTETVDYRVAALEKAVAILIDGDDHRAKRVLELFSDPTNQLAERAEGKGASGVWPGPSEESE